MGKISLLMLLWVMAIVFSGCSAKIDDISVNTTKNGKKYSFYPNGSSENDEYYFVDW